MDTTVELATDCHWTKKTMRVDPGLYRGNLNQIARQPCNYPTLTLTFNYFQKIGNVLD